jgi:hypothetical protein
MLDLTDIKFAPG